jgi:hypothetical protein
MLKRPVGKAQNREDTIWDEQVAAKEKIEFTLTRLQMLKHKIIELRLQCEELQKLHLENKEKPLLCSECGCAIEQGKEVIVRDSAGKEMGHYHKECFHALWF